MIASRRWANPTRESAQSPSPSGPRWAMGRLIAWSDSRLKPFPVKLMMPAIPHINMLFPLSIPTAGGNPPKDSPIRSLRRVQIGLSIYEPIQGLLQGPIRATPPTGDRCHPHYYSAGSGCSSSQSRQRSRPGSTSRYRQPLSGQIMIPSESGLAKRWPCRLTQPRRRAGTPSIRP